MLTNKEDIKKKRRSQDFTVYETYTLFNRSYYMK